jgi:hypothetical protein
MRFVLILLLAGCCLLAQTGAVNGSIQGTVTDASGSVVPNASVKAVNLATGYTRQTVTNSGGLYDLPLLPLGAYRVEVSASGFAAFVRSGVSVEVNRATALDVHLEVAGTEQTVTVEADASLLRVESSVAGTLSQRSMENLPITSRNVQNLALFVPGVTGRRDDEFGTTQFAFGGMDRRGFMVDGADNTQRGGQLRLGIFSTETIAEVKVEQNAMAAEYGRTVGGIVNMVTRGGSNDFHGMFLYLARRPGLIARPSLAAVKPFQQRATYSLTLSGPVRKDKVFFFANGEFHPLDQPRPITISPANAAALGLAASELGAAPFAQRFQTYTGRVDFQIDARHSGFGRYVHFYTPSKFNTSGGLLQRSAGNNFNDRQSSGVVQLTSVFSANTVNEFRFGDLWREFYRPPVSGVIGPVVQITGVANLVSNAAANQRYLEHQNQFIDNLSIRRGRHAVKLGFDIATIKVAQFDRLAQTFQFANLTQYLNTINRVTNPATGRPFLYEQLTQQFGDNTAEHRTQFYNFYVQDEWRVRRDLTLYYGLRWEMPHYPQLSVSAPLLSSRTINSDLNNFGPRAGFAWQVSPKTVVRGGYGLFYDTLNLRLISAVVRNDGQRVQTFRINGTDPLAPAFPAGFTALPDSRFGVRPSVTTFDANLTTLYAHQANLQVEQELARDLSVTLGLQYYGSHRAPLLIDRNLPAVTGTLADGRPIYGGATRPDARFTQVLTLSALGNSNYHGLFLALNKRFSRGFLATASYTWSKAINDTDSSGDAGSSPQDSLNVRGDRGLASSHQQHRFVLQAVWQPRFSGPAQWLTSGWLLAPNVTWTSGFPVNVVAGSDLNRDLVNNDRPLGLGRNSLIGPGFKEINLRLSRTFRLTERFGLELIGEAENLLNSTNAACGVGGCSGAVVNRFGAADFLRVTSALNSRQIQLGGRLRF